MGDMLSRRSRVSMLYQIQAYAARRPRTPLIATPLVAVGLGLIVAAT
jgi:hypothetical protein